MPAKSIAVTVQCLAIAGGIVPTTANDSIRVDSTSSSPTDDSARTVGSKIRMGVREEVFGVHITKPTLIVTPTAVPDIKKTIIRPTCLLFNSCVLVCVVLLTFRDRITSRGVPIFLFRQPK